MSLLLCSFPPFLALDVLAFIWLSDGVNRPFHYKTTGSEIESSDCCFLNFPILNYLVIDKAGDVFFCFIFPILISLDTVRLYGDPSINVLSDNA